MRSTSYSSQINLTLHAEGTETDVALKQKVDELYPESKLRTLSFSIDDSVNDEKFNPLHSIDSHSRLYIHGHGSKDTPEYIYDNDNNKLHYKDLAKLLANHLTDDGLKSNNGSRLKISLIVCEGAYFGKKLHEELKNEYGIYCDLSARIPIMMIARKTGKKHTVSHDISKAAFFEMQRNFNATSGSDRFAAAKISRHVYTHRQPASKITFSWDVQGNQIIQDAYAGLLKKKLLHILTEHSNEANPTSMRLLHEDINAINNDADIVNLLQGVIRAGNKYQIIFPRPHINPFLIKLKMLIEENKQSLTQLAENIAKINKPAREPNRFNLTKIGLFSLTVVGTLAATYFFKRRF